jgi:hypothetical protein
MKHCMAPALFTQLALQLDPLAILGLAMADGTPRTSKIAAAVNDQVVVRERFILQLLSYSSFIRRDCAGEMTRKVTSTHPDSCTDLHRRSGAPKLLRSEVAR